MFCYIFQLLYFVFDKDFKFIDVIEVFSTYERFSSKDLKKLNASKKNLETIISNDDADSKAIKIEFIKIASIIAPNLKSKMKREIIAPGIQIEIIVSEIKPCFSFIKLPD